MTLKPTGVRVDHSPVAERGREDAVRSEAAVPAPRSGAPALPDLDLFRTVIENLPQSAVYVFDHDLRFLAAEGERLRAHGLDHIVGMRLREVAEISTETADQLEVHYRAALRGIDADFEHPGPDGRWYRVRVRPVRSGGAIVAGMVVSDDITELRDAREAARAAQAFQEAVFTAVPEVVTIFDVEAGQNVWTSRALESQIGEDLAAIRRRGISVASQVLHPEDLEAYHDGLRRAAAAADGEIVESSVRARHADGSWRRFQRRSTPFLRAADGTVRQVLNVSHDITPQEVAAAELARAHALNDAVLRTTPDLIVLIDVEERRLAWTSREVDALLGPADEVRLDRFHLDDLGSLDDAWRATLKAADGEVVQSQARYRQPDGSWVWVGHRMSPFARDGSGRVTQVIALLRDVSEVIRVERDLEHAATHDPLTGLPNRRLVTERLQHALAQRGVRVALLFVDLDGFKPVNDLHGHAAGDVVLRVTAERISAVVRHGDTVGRIGGDEFLVVLTGDEEHFEERAASVARRLVAEIEQPIADCSVSASIGIAYAADGDDAETVLSEADAAMYAEKALRKAR